VKFAITGQERGDLLIEVTAWAGLAVVVLNITQSNLILHFIVFDLIFFMVIILMMYYL
jgi:hypothetical protein